jgi:hypothetical protein
VNVARSVRGTLVVSAGGSVVASQPLALAPDGAFESTFKALEERRSYTLRLEDATGAPLIEHTEGVLDVVPAGEVKTGRQPVPRYPPPATRSEGDTLALGVEQERDGKRLIAFETYGDGLKRFPESLPLLVARGRMAVDLQRYAEAAPLLERARLRSSSDPEILYPLALSLAAVGNERQARTYFEGAQRFPAFRAAAGTRALASGRPAGTARRGPRAPARDHGRVERRDPRRRAGGRAAARGEARGRGAAAPAALARARSDQQPAAPRGRAAGNLGSGALEPPGGRA